MVFFKKMFCYEDKHQNNAESLGSFIQFENEYINETRSKIFTDATRLITLKHF